MGNRREYASGSRRYSEKLRSLLFRNQDLQYISCRPHTSQFTNTHFKDLLFVFMHEKRLTQLLMGVDL